MNIKRVGRSPFNISMLISFGIILLLIILYTFFNVPIGVPMIFIFVNFFWMIILYIGRLHDVGFSGWWTLLAMPLQGLGLIVLMIWPGKKEANAYGPVPPSSVSYLLHFWRTETFPGYPQLDDTMGV